MFLFTSFCANGPSTYDFASIKQSLHSTYGSFERLINKNKLNGCNGPEEHTNTLSETFESTRYTPKR